MWSLCCCVSLRGLLQQDGTSEEEEEGDIEGPQPCAQWCDEELVFAVPSSSQLRLWCGVAPPIFTSDPIPKRNGAGKFTNKRIHSNLPGVCVCGVCGGACVGSRGC